MSSLPIKLLPALLLSTVVLGGCVSEDPEETPTPQTVTDTSGKTVTFTPSQGKLENLQKVAQPASVPRGLVFPNGFFSYKITGLTAGATVKVTVQLPQGSNPTSVVKCNNNVCTPFAGGAVSGNTVTLTVTDGGAGDTDTVAGQITDPFAPARDTSTRQYAAVAAVAPDFSSGAHSVIDDAAPRTAQNNLDAAGSDLAIAARGKYIYRIERFGTDKIRRYDVAAPGTSQWGQGFSTNDVGDTSSNAYDLVFASDTKAYLIRYGSTKAWIVDPSVTAEAQFKKGELNLAAYADADGVPEMSAAVVVGSRLYIVMQRYENFSTLKTAYLAVFDTTTDMEIDTARGAADGVKGLPLLTKNPVELLYSADDNRLYVASAGVYACGFCQPATPAEYTGGVEQIDPANFTTRLVIDDSASTGNIGDIAIASPTLGYVIGSASFGSATLFRFNPSGASTQTLTPVNGMSAKDLAFAALDREDFLWVGQSVFNDASKTGVVILDTTQNDRVDQTISTNLSPIGIAFGEITK